MRGFCQASDGGGGPLSLNVGGMDRETRDGALRYLAYRLQCVATGQLALTYVQQWMAVPSLEIRFEGKATGFTNPVIEIALVHYRALMDFLGLKSLDGRTLVERTGGKRDDLLIEHFSNSDGSLRRARPEDVVAPHLEPPLDPQIALAYALRMTNKAIAHMTTHFDESEESLRHLDIAFRGVQALMSDRFYAPLGIARPDYALKSRSRTA